MQGVVHDAKPGGRCQTPSGDESCQVLRRLLGSMRATRPRHYTAKRCSDAGGKVRRSKGCRGNFLNGRRVTPLPNGSTTKGCRSRSQTTTSRGFCAARTMSAGHGPAWKGIIYCRAACRLPILSQVLLFIFNYLRAKLAERVGFEPTVRKAVHLISSQAHSTTLAPLPDCKPCPASRSGPRLRGLRIVRN